MEHDSQNVLIVGRDLVVDLLPMRECITLLEEMFREIAMGKVVLPLRTVLPIPDQNGALAIMPAYVEGKTPVTGAKVITVFPENLNTPYEAHQGCVLLFECNHGRLLAILDASSITAIRTAAASAVATKFLARKDASNLAILGSGVQASTHLAAMCEVRDIKKVTIWSRDEDHATRFVAKHPNLVQEISTAPSVSEALRGADIICTTTASPTPLVKGEYLKEGVHINAVGASRPEFRELDSAAVARSRIYADRLESLLNESGDFLIPRKEGTVGDDNLRGEIGDLLVGKIPGRKDDNEITLFKSLGIASEDIVSASHIYEKALESKTGLWVNFGNKGQTP